MALVIAAGGVHLASQWSTAWGAISGALGTNVTTLLGVIGVFMVVGGVVGWLWERRKGGGSHSKLFYSIVIGAILSAPGFIIPMILTLADGIANGIAALLGL